MTISETFNPLGAMRPMLITLAALLVPVSATESSAGSPWSWPQAEVYAPPSSLFTDRGVATVEFGAQYAAPGAPADKEHLYGVIRYRDNLDGLRDYDLFFSPTLTIWQFWRYELDHGSYAQYVGGFHYDNCQDGYVTAMDRVFMPAIGLHSQYGTQADQPGGDVNTLVITNYGCMNGHFSWYWPIDNFAGSGSGDGVLPSIPAGPTWTQATQTLHAVSISLPWVYYPGVLDPESPRFLLDFPVTYADPIPTMIQSQIALALENVRLENQIRVFPDGTIMLTHIWTDLKARPWVPHTTDGYWLAPDSAPNGRVWYFDTSLTDYVDPFEGGQNPDGLYLTTGNGWVGYFVDQLRPELGIGFHYSHEAGGISILPAHNWPNVPSVLHTDYWTNIVSHGRAFRQMFITVGTKEDMQAKAAVLDGYTEVFSIEPLTTETFCNDGIDDDHDGLIDCADYDCGGGSICRRYPDFDPDGDVDQEDFGHLQACFTGSILEPISPGCEDADLNYDSHVDQDDFGVLQGCLSGADVPYMAGCQE